MSDGGSLSSGRSCSVQYGECDSRITLAICRRLLYCVRCVDVTYTFGGSLLFSMQAVSTLC